MKPRELGRIQAAREIFSDIINPYNDDTSRMEFDTGADEVFENRKRGRDPGGHVPPPPHLCAADPTKVCNCCENCAAPCAAEAAKLQPPNRDKWLLPRIAFALERIVNTNKPVGWNICNACGCTLVPMSGTCPVCGEKS